MMNVDINESLSLVVPAAGAGRRLEKDLPKAYVHLGGRPLLEQTLRRLHRCVGPRETVVLLPPPSRRPEHSSLHAFLEDRDHIKSIPGGKTRFHSVRKGVRSLDQKEGYIMVHDGARPLVTGEVVSRVVSEAQREGGAIAGIPVSDTVKRTEDHTILETVDREDLILAQTPQVFDEDRFREALEQIDEEKISGITDDAMVMKEAGYEVRTARGDRWNIKVTYPSDLRVATHFM